MKEDVCKYSLHVFHDNVEEVLFRLAQCQYYSDTLDSKVVQQLKEKIRDTDSVLHQTIHVLKALQRTKQNKVKFYSIPDKKCISVYSDFFRHSDAFDFSKGFFDDLAALVVAVEIEENLLVIDFRKGGKHMQSVRVDYKSPYFASEMNSQLATLFHQWQFIDNKTLHSSVYVAIERAVGLQSYSNSHIIQYLQDNAIVDEYVL